MFVSSSLFGNPYFLGYVLVFGGATLACLIGASRARQITDPDTRHGLVALLLTSGGWAAAHLGYLLVAGPVAKRVFYVIGLLVGFATVWTWLYFCSAYTGRSLHRNRSLWTFAAATYAVVALVKLTNPLHELYYTLEFTATPFAHYTVRHELMYWVIMGLSYALAMAGYFMLVELYTRIGNDTKPLLGLTFLTALPAVFNLVGYANPLFLDITHEPLGVAVFTIGVLFVYITEFQAVQLAGGREDPAIAISEDGRIRDYNEPATVLFPSLTDRGAVGTPLRNALPEVAAVLEGEQRPLLERDQETGPRYYRVTENRFGTRGTPLGRLILLDDVTQQKEYEEQLRAAKEAAEEADRLKTAMLANMSHELRTPLTSIKGYAEMLEETLDGQPRVFAEKIEHGSNRLSRTLDSVLDLSELEAGTRELEREQVDLTAVSEEVTEMHRPAADEASLSLELDRPTDPVVSTSNEAAVHRIVDNLVDNAIKFTPEGGAVAVRVRNGEDAIVEVEDTGIGIEEEALPEVFEAFRQESEGIDREFEGTGLGLSIVKELTDALDGEIAIDTEKGKGTHVVVRLPPGE